MRSTSARSFPDATLLSVLFFSVATLAGCSDGGDSGNFSVGGKLAGLSNGETVVLNDGEETLTLENDDQFTLPRAFGDGDSYNITVSEHPVTQGCEIENASGSIDGSNVNDLIVSCRAPARGLADPRNQKLLVSWEAEPDTTYNLYWSSDPELEPESYGAYADSGMAVDIESPFTLDGLSNTRNYYLFLESDYGTNRFSERFGTRPNAAAVSGDVIAIERDSQGNLYLGGWIQSAGYSAGGLIAIDREGEMPVHSPYVNGMVTAIEPDGSGGYFVAGLFDSADGQDMQSFIRLNPDLSLDTEWEVPVSGLVFSILVQDDRILLGGSFDQVNGVERHGIAAIDHDGEVLAFNADLGTAPEYDGQVMDLTITDDHLIVAGAFSTIGGVSRENLAALSPEGDVDLSWQADADNMIIKAVRHDDRIYIAGEFQNVKGSNRIAAAALDLNGNVLSFDPEIKSGGILALTVINDVVYLGGIFEGPSDNLLAIDTSGNPVTVAAGEPDSTVTLVRELDGNILISGSFRNIGDSPRSGMALLTDTGELADGLQVGIEGAFGFHDNGETLLVGSLSGTTYGSVGHNNLVKLTSDGDVAGWETGLDDQVFALALQNDTLYVGGRFTESDTGEERQYLAAFDVASGKLDSNWTPEVDGDVSAMVARSGELHIGGFFENINGSSQTYLATLNANGQLVDRMPQPNDPVSVMTRDGGNLYLAGRFSEIDGTTRIGLAAVNSTNGELLDWAPDVTQSHESGLQINAIDVFGGNVYLGGSFDNAEGAGRINLAAYSTAGSLLPWKPDAESTVQSLLATASGIHVGGSFTRVAGEDTDRFAILDFDGDAKVTLETNSSLVTNTMIEIDGGFCLGSSWEAFILDGQLGSGIACLDDELKRLW